MVFIIHDGVVWKLQFPNKFLEKSDVVTFDDLTAALKRLKAVGLQSLAFCNAEWYVQRYDYDIKERKLSEKCLTIFQVYDTTS
jgi:hypothetical protein